MSSGGRRTGSAARGPAMRPSFRHHPTMSRNAWPTSSGSFTPRTTNFPCWSGAGLAHVQFETIHPFLDGNGRLGRLLITLMLCDAGLLREPLLYLSLYFKRNRSTYYRLLGDTRRTGDWEAWLRFFLEGVREVAEAGVATARSVSETIRDDRSRIGRLGRRAGSALRVHQSLVERPAGGIRHLARRTGLSAPTVAAVLRVLEDLDIVREVTGRQRGRIYAYERYLAVLREGTEDPAGSSYRGTRRAR